MTAKTPDELFRLLTSLGISTTTVQHPPLHTVEESRALRGSLAGGHTKNLFLKDKKGRLFLVVAQEETPVALKSLHARIGAQGRLSFVDGAKMAAILGVSPGSVTAFALANDAQGAVTLVLDETLLAHDMINCHPLVNTATTTISRSDLLRFFDHTGHRPLVTALGDETPGILPAGGEQE